MKKFIIVLTMSVVFLLPGCSTVSSIFNRPPKVETKEVWWGTKQECIDFLNSPQAKAKRWFVQSLGGEA